MASSKPMEMASSEETSLQQVLLKDLSSCRPYIKLTLGFVFSLQIKAGDCRVPHSVASRITVRSILMCADTGHGISLFGNPLQCRKPLKLFRVK